MISMRYARNFANGDGLVWNPGSEKIEGYTNPLWVLYMSLFHLMPIPASKMSLLIQISGALFLLINLFFIKKIAGFISNNSKLISLSAVFLTAFYLPLSIWSLQGMEISILILLLSISTWLLFNCIKFNIFSFGIFILLGIGILIRPDFAIIYMAVLIFLIITDEKNRKKNFVFGLSIFLCFILLQTIFRILYYDEILPNTYYLKMTGYPFFLRISRGVYVFVKFIWTMNWIIFLIPLSIIFFRRDKYVVFLLCIFSVQIFYSIYVGGDAWESKNGSNRYLSIVMPVFFILFSYSSFLLIRNFSNFLVNNYYRIRKLRTNILFVLFIVLLLFSFTNFNSFYRDDFGPNSLSELLLFKKPTGVGRFKIHINNALTIDKITNKEAKIAVVFAGVTPYFSNRYYIDLLGRNDKKIAREKSFVYSGFEKFIGFYPGHSKYNFNYSIVQLNPDIILGLWRPTKENKLYIDNHYREIVINGIRLTIRKNSNKILWNKINYLKK
ncbi:MAG: hypothetical protein IH852_09385 [Bacteroidetes bacterium]|nr:hypothetical protein [Bacteroidota bacterium]